MAIDVEMHDTESDYDDSNAARHFKIAVDFGTTCSSVAFIALTSEFETLPERIRADNIPLIDKYPDAPTEGYYTRLAVPTESWYPMSKKRQKAQAKTQKDPNISNDSSLEVESSTDGESGSEAAMADMDADLEMDHAKEYLWGFEVQDRLWNIGLKADNGHYLTWFKLMLDKSEETAFVREKLADKLKDLKAQRLIKKEWNVIADYLQRLFEHTKDQLETKHGFNDTCTVEFILCVPALWGPPARRDMHTAMAEAIQRSGLHKLEDKSIDNLFIVSEPEAAALCVTEIHRIVRHGEAFVLIDAGGGTVDAITYRVTRRHPLRLEKEEVPAKAILKGSTYLNMACERIIRERVCEGDLLAGSVPLDKVIAHAMGIFENITKRKIDITDPIKGKARLTMPGLIRDRAKRFSENTIHLSQGEVKTIFNDVIEPIGNLMLEQLDQARECNVKNVILIGGFAESVSLQKHLKATLNGYNERLGRNIGFLTPNAPGTAVAQGAVIRAIRKEEGPVRHIQSSYGFLSSEPYDPENIKEHKGARRTFDKTDGETYVKDTIRWLIKKGTTVGASYAEKILSSHHFKEFDTKGLICEERLYVSDEVCEDHYPLSHKKNKDAGALLIGKVTFDMTHLKTNGLIEPQQPEPQSGLRARYYKVAFDLIMRVEGRNLRFEAVYPPTENGDWRDNHPGIVQKYGQVSIASAFEHGTE